MNPWKGLKGLPRNIWLISAGTLINRAGSMVMPFLALYLTQGLRVSTAKAGLIIASYGIGSLISAPFAGKLSDKIGPLKLMKYSLFLTGFIFLLYSFVRNYYLLFLVTVLLAVISESFRPASMAFISDQTTTTQRKNAFALYRLAINVGMSIGPVAGGFLSAINFSLLFYSNAAAALCAGMFFLFTRWQKSEPEDEDKKIDSNYISTSSNTIVIKDYTLLYFLISFLPILTIFFQILSTIPLFIVNELGYARSTFGLLLTVNTVLVILIEVPLNTAMSHWEDRKSLFLGCVLTAIGFGAMAFANDIFSLVISITIWSFGEMIIFPSSSTYVSKIAVKGKTGEYMGYYQMTTALSFLLAPAAGTWVLESFGSFNLWIWSFVFGMISAIMMLWIKRKK
ncbi:MAG: MFS transporter [bacterium]